MATQNAVEAAKAADDVYVVPATPASQQSTSKLVAKKPSFLREVGITVRKGIWQNRLPTLMAIIVGCSFMGLYYGVPVARPGFEAVAAFEKTAGVLFSLVASLVCGGLAPLLFQVCLTKSLPQPFLSHLIFIVVFWSFLGVYVKGQYTLNEWINGSEANLGTVLRKMACDQFLFSPFVNYVWITACFRFRDCNFSCSQFKASLKDRRGLMLQFCSMNVANWSTWLPGTAVIYSMPSDLQMPCWSVIIFFYSSLLTLISANAGAKETEVEMEATQADAKDDDEGQAV